MRSLLQVKATGFVFGAFLMHPKSITKRCCNSFTIDIVIRSRSMLYINTRTILYIMRGPIFFPKTKTHFDCPPTDDVNGQS